MEKLEKVYDELIRNKKIWECADKIVDEIRETLKKNGVNMVEGDGYEICFNTMAMVLADSIAFDVANYITTEVQIRERIPDK